MIVFYLILIFIILMCIVGIVLSVKFQKKQEKKYNTCIDLIRKNKVETLQIKNGLNSEEILSIDENVDINDLMKSLYNKYLCFQDKLNNLDYNLDDLLVGNIKDYYENIINNYKQNDCQYITDNINLIGYSIVEFNKRKLKFKINIECSSYKKNNNKIIYGNEFDKIEQVLLIGYDKIKDDWLINSYEKVYEKKRGA